MSRRVSLVVFLGIASALVLATGLTAGAAEDTKSKRLEVGSAEERLMQVRQDAAAAQGDYNHALFELNELDAEIEETEAGLSTAEERLARAQKDLEDRASQVYKSGNVGFMDVLVGVEDFSNFASRMDLWLDLLSEERAEFDRVKQARDELQAKRDQLKAQRAERVETIDAAIARKEAAEEAEAEAENYLNSLSADLQASIQADQERRAERARARAEELSQQFVAQVAETEPEPQVQTQESDAEQEEARRAAEQAELEAQRRAAERRAAEERAAELAEAQRQAELAAEKEAARQQEAAERAAARKAAREEARRQAAAQRAAEREARRLAVQQEAAELAAQQAERQAALKAERRQARQAERRQARQAERQQAQEAQAAEEQYALASEEPAASEIPDRVPEPEEEHGGHSAPAPQPAGSTESVLVQGGTVAPHVQGFADDACNQLAACTSSTYAGHYPSTELALDILVSEGWGLYPSDETLGNAVASFALNNIGAYKVDYVIWANQIAGPWNGYQWEPYGGYGATDGHWDHVHIGFTY